MLGQCFGCRRRSELGSLVLSGAGSVPPPVCPDLVFGVCQGNSRISVSIPVFQATCPQREPSSTEALTADAACASWNARTFSQHGCVCACDTARKLWPRVRRSLSSCEKSPVRTLMAWRGVSRAELTPPSVQPMIFFFLSLCLLSSLSNRSSASSYLHRLSVLVDRCPSKAAEMMLRHLCTTAPNGQTRQCPLERSWPRFDTFKKPPPGDRQAPAVTQRWTLSPVFFCSSSLWTCLSLGRKRHAGTIQNGMRKCLFYWLLIGC